MIAIGLGVLFVGVMHIGYMIGYSKCDKNWMKVINMMGREEEYILHLEQLRRDLENQKSKKG